MSSRILLLFTLFLIILSSPTHAQERFLPIQEINTPGGLTAWLVTDKTLPLLSIEFIFDGAGSKNNEKDKQGVAKLLSNMLDEGAGELKSQEFLKQLTDQSISLSFAVNRDHFSGQMQTLTRYQDNAFDLLKLALTAPRFDEEPLERMRQANLSRLKSSLGNPNWIAQRIFNDVAYAGHPYALNAGGTIRTLNTITKEDLKNYKDQYLTKDRLVIGVAGNISKEDLIPLLDETFGDLPVANKKKTEQTLELQNKGQTFFYEKDIPQTIIIQSVESLPVNDPDYPAQQVLNYIFGSSGFGSRLMTEAREKQGLTYGIYSSISNMDEINLLDISTSTDNANSTTMLEIIDKEIEKLLADITDEEIKDAKSYLTGSLPLALTSTSGIADIVTSLQINNRPIDYLDNYNERIENVTKADLNRVAKRLFENKLRLTVMIGQPVNAENYKKITDIPNAE